MQLRVCPPREPREQRSPVRGVLVEGEHERVGLPTDTRGVGYEQECVDKLAQTGAVQVAAGGQERKGKWQVEGYKNTVLN